MFLSLYSTPHNISAGLHSSQAVYCQPPRHWRYSRRIDGRRQRQSPDRGNQEKCMKISCDRNLCICGNRAYQEKIVYCTSVKKGKIESASLTTLASPLAQWSTPSCSWPSPPICPQPSPLPPPSPSSAGESVPPCPCTLLCPVLKMLLLSSIRF